MKIRAIILAGGEGSRLGILTAKRTKPAVPFGGKYRIIDFTLSNCINSGLVDVMIMAQYRPHSLIEHIGAGGPWDLNRDFTGGVRIYTPYTNRSSSNWYTGTADAIQQNFSFIKRDNPDALLILSGDHIYAMDYDSMITFHADHGADLTMATIRVPIEEASRFGIVGVGSDYRVTSFIEKPAQPESDLANMGVYVFNTRVLDRALWEDHRDPVSNHDFGKNIIPSLLASGASVYAFPYTGYWVDVGTLLSYWQAHMDLLNYPPPIDLNNRGWIIHTRTEERPPARIVAGAVVIDSLLSNGCVIEPGARVVRSVLSPGVTVQAGAVVEEAVILSDVTVGPSTTIRRAIIDKHVKIGQNSHLGAADLEGEVRLVTIGKNSNIPDDCIIEAGATIGTDVCLSDFTTHTIKVGETILTRRMPYEV